MYDFYANPPNTRNELREWLTSWLEPVNDDTPLTINNETFIQEKGFRRAFHLHCVFRSLQTNEYIWWVFEEQPPLNMFPSQRYPTYKALLDSVIEDYYTQWKLTG
jgi:hypothetical protein